MNMKVAPRARRRVPGALRETAPAVGGDEGVAEAPAPLPDPEPEPEPLPPPVVGEALPPPLPEPEPPPADWPGIRAWATFFAALA